MSTRSHPGCSFGVLRKARMGTRGLWLKYFELIYAGTRLRFVAHDNLVFPILPEREGALVAALHARVE